MIRCDRKGWTSSERGSPQKGCLGNFTTQLVLDFACERSRLRFTAGVPLDSDLQVIGPSDRWTKFKPDSKDMEPDTLM